MDIAALATLSGLLLVKEMGIPVPVPGDLLVIGAGAATSGRPEAIVWLGAILIAGYVGGTVQFLLVRGAMRRPVVALLARLGVSAAVLDGLAGRLRTGGPRAVAVARATPGLRMASIAASGVAALPARTFVGGLVAGNTVFVGGHFALGFVVGKPALGTAAVLGNPAVLLAMLVTLSAAGALGWILIRRRRPAVAGAAASGSAARPESGADVRDEAGYAAWADAACPICFTLAVARAAPAP